MPKTRKPKVENGLQQNTASAEELLHKAESLHQRVEQLHQETENAHRRLEDIHRRVSENRARAKALHKKAADKKGAKK